VPRSTNALINLVAEQNTDRWRKKCPPQEKSLFAYFFGVVKSMAPDGARPVGFAQICKIANYLSLVLKPGEADGPCFAPTNSVAHIISQL